MLDIKITKATSFKEKKDASTLPFGTYFTDHMFIMDYNDKEGWHDARIVTYGPLAMDPSACVYHYAMEVFEGLKAYKTAEGEVRLFRPDCNWERMNNSAVRLSLPTIEKEDFIQAVKAIVDLERDWVPAKKGESLYIRPFLMSVEPDLSLHCSEHCMFVIICCPVGNYYKEGLQPVSIAIEEEDSRTVKGGTGFAKCGGNYAAAQRAGLKAEAKGISQVLWLDGASKTYIEEVGSMNVMFRIDGEIITPTLETGTVLPGVTRRSIIQLLKEDGYKVTERLVSVEEIIKACKEGRIEEAFGCGTAAVVSPIGKLIFEGKDYIMGDGGIGPVTHKMFEELTNLQWGLSEDTHGWIYKV